MSTDVTPREITKHTYRYLGDLPMQDSYSIDIEDDGDTKRVFFNSRIHMNKRVEFPVSYSSSEFSDWKILHDSEVYKAVSQRYGRVTVCPHCSSLP